MTPDRLGRLGRAEIKTAARRFARMVRKLAKEAETCRQEGADHRAGAGGSSGTCYGGAQSAADRLFLTAAKPSLACGAPGQPETARQSFGRGWIALIGSGKGERQA